MLIPHTRGMTVLLAFMTAMGPISTDLYVPALPQLAAELSTTAARVQWTLSMIAASPTPARRGRSEDPKLPL